MSSRRLAAIITLHDPNLASMFSDRIAIMGEGRIVALGSPEEVLVPEILSRVYAFPVNVHKINGLNLITPGFKEL